MQRIKKTTDYTIYQKRSAKYAVRSNEKPKPWINGVEKVRILVQEGLLDVPVPETVEAEELETTATEAPAEEATEATEATAETSEETAEDEAQSEASTEENDSDEKE